MIDRQTTSPRFKSVRFFIPALFGKKVLPKFIELCMETPCWCPSEGHQRMAAVKQQKRLSLSFATETKKYYSRVLIH